MSEPSPPNGHKDDPVHVEVVDREPKVPLSLVLKVMAIGFALAALFPISVTIFINSRQTDHRLKENQELALSNQRLALQNKKLSKQIADFATQVCLNGERRDAAQVHTNKSIIAVLHKVPETPALADLVDSLVDQNTILEPPGEQDCEVPTTP